MLIININPSCFSLIGLLGILVGSCGSSWPVNLVA